MSPERYFASAPNIRVSSSVGATLIANLRNIPEMQIDPTTNMPVVPSECLPSDLCGVWLDPPSVGYKHTCTHDNIVTHNIPVAAICNHDLST